MNSDPFYQDITNALNAQLDESTFERCAVSLLRDDGVNVVPVVGGSDAGMDGSIADFCGEPYPLISTTGADALRNLRKNLASYVNAGGSRREAIFATSRELTPLRQRHLRDAARELGFQLHQIYTQAAFAELLYHNPPWCQQLLGLSGNPPALSRIPKTRRALISEHMIGRENEIEWLQGTSGDRLLVGEPGSGKTSLLHGMTQRGEGLFVISDDTIALANAIRRQRPSALIVDDAHFRLDTLESLKYIREQMGAGFCIVASSWPGGQEAVAEILSLPQNGIRKVERLTRPQIVEVIKGVGVLGPDELIGNLVDQSVGQPGLAVTLAQLCLQGDIPQVVYGDALTRTLTNTFNRLLGDRAVGVLAAISVGGDSGIQLTHVGAVLQVPLLELQEIVSGLAFGGVIRETETGCLAVRPLHFRATLVRDYFFCGARSLPIEDLLSCSRNLESALHTVIEACTLGATFDEQWLQELITQANSSALWKHYARLGAAQVRYILRSSPSLINVIINEALHCAPEVTLEHIFDVGKGLNDQCNWESTFSALKSWIETANPETPAALDARQLLVRFGRRWLLSGGRTELGFRTFNIGFSPRYESSRLDPGAGNTLTISRALLCPDDIGSLQRLWGEMTDTLSLAAVSDIAGFFGLVEDYVYLDRRGGDIASPSHKAAATEFARQVLQDCIPLVKGHPGLSRRVREIAGRIDLDLELLDDPEFEVLFPADDDFENWDGQRQARVGQARQLGSRWVNDNPDQVTSRICHLEKFAKDSGRRYPRWTPQVCYVIAGETNCPREWIGEFVEHKVDADLLMPFLRRLASLRSCGWQDTLRSVMARDEYCSSVASVILALNPADDSLVASLLCRPDISDLITKVQWIGDTPDSVLIQLFLHESEVVAAYSAANYWLCSQGHLIPNNLFQDWRRGVLRCDSNLIWMEQVLQQYPELAGEWLERQINRGSYYNFRSSAIDTALMQLEDENRLSLIRGLPEDFYEGQFVARLVNGNPDLLRELLGRRELRYLHLQSLGYCNDAEKSRLAGVALEAGYSRQDVAHGLFPGSMSWMGEESEMWLGCVHRLRALTETAQGAFREILAIALSEAESRRSDALARERRREVFGEW